MKMRDLLNRQDDIVKAMRSIAEKPEGQNGDLSEAQETRSKELQAELARVKHMISLQADIDDAEQRMSGKTVSEGDFEAECRAFSLHRAIKAMIAPNSVDAGREREISQELQRREGRSTEGILAPYSAIFEKRTAGPVTTTLPSSHAGGNLVPTEHLGNEYIDLLRASDPLQGLGIRRLSGLTGNVSIPKARTGTAVGWVAENSAVAQTDMAFDSVTLSPKHCGAYAVYSRQMLLQSSPSIEDIVKADLALTLSKEIADTVIAGTGTDNQPKGILNYSGIQAVTYTAETDKMNYVPELENKLLLSNVTNISILARNSFKKTVDEMLTTDKLPVGDAAFYRGIPHKYVDDDLITSGQIMLAGDFSQVIIGTWGGVEVLVNPYADSVYTLGNVAIRILLTMDVALRHEEAFATLSLSE